MIRDGIVEWDGRKLEPRSPVTEARGPYTVADLLIEDRE